ncbi:hypothetical protein H7H51_05170 [Mycolicibacterium farcinogenes]|nr:hypothetical protein [Mycolicibacterium farcinogenes]
MSVYEGNRLIENDVDRRLGGLPDVINGSVTLAAHIASLRGAASYYEALGLGYRDSLFAPDQPLFSMRFTVSYAASVQSTDGPLARSLGESDGVDLGYAMPYTGNGFTAPGQMIPEYWIVGGVLMEGELWFVPVDGPEVLAAVLTRENEWAAVRREA